MLTTLDEKHLVRAITHNQCILFLGAGFSSDAIGASGKTLPVGSELASRLWGWLGYDTKYGAYDYTPLDRLFDVARKEKGDRKLLEFLRGELLIREYPEWYKLVAYPYWRRIYTTNVDDLIELVYRDTKTTRLTSINGITGRYRERDAYLEHLHYVKLNGSLANDLDEITFGTRQYAKRSAEYGVWYDQFVRDYSTHATILVGTNVNEPQFWREVEARQGREGAAQELRLRSFLISNKFSPVVAKSLEDFNVVPVVASSRDFFEYLNTLISPWPDRDDMLMHVNPQRAQYLRLPGGLPVDQSAAKSFFANFTRIEVQDVPVNYRSLFHHGATPDWNDIAAGMDAQREVTAEAQARIEEAIEHPGTCPCIVITGHRGAGKSTLLMRTALNLSAAGHLVFFCVGEDVPDADTIASAVSLVGKPMALVIDDAEWIAGRTDSVVEALRKVKLPPVVVFGIRASALHSVTAGPDKEIWLDDLTEPDIDAVIDILTKFNALGVMAGQPRTNIREAFRVRANKQLLVAMKEVTTGRQFDEIIAKEYSDLVDPELRLTYLIACLATAAGASLKRGQLLACSELAPALLLSGLERELRQVLIRADDYGDRVIARHGVIAESVIERSASPAELGTAYRRILSVLANDMDSQAKTGEPHRWFRLYKKLVNHKDLYYRFERNIDEARGIFESLMGKLTNDAHFWLQYGSLELEYGELDLASRYVTTAEALAPNQFVVRNTKGHLLFALSIAAPSGEVALDYRRQATDILNELIVEHGDNSDYPWHILLTHTLEWLTVWEHDPVERRKELKDLRRRAIEAAEARPRSRAVKLAREQVEKAYMGTAIT